MKKLIIEQDGLIHNINIIKEAAGDSVIIAVLKGNGYGLGLVEYAEALRANGINFFAVALLDEAVVLRNYGFECPILMLTPPYNPVEASVIADFGVTASVVSPYSAQLLEEAAIAAGKKLDVHIKLDTGFGRFGFLPGKAVPALMAEHPRLVPKGIYTHLSFSFEKNGKSALRQFYKFVSAVDEMELNGFKPGMRHIANSCALLRFPQMRMDAVRIGSAFLGRVPISAHNLERVCHMESLIIDIKELPPGHNIGYADTFRTEHITRIGVIPVGYKDGFAAEKARDVFRINDVLRYMFNDLRSLGKRIFVTVNGKKVPLLGRVSMYNIIVDLTGINAHIGDAVRLDINPLFVESTVEREYV